VVAQQVGTTAIATAAGFDLGDVAAGEQQQKTSNKEE
jgi:hypothetical protein